MSTTAPKGKSLVIVESPAKAKTINKYLGDNYVVKASMGHVRDLPTRKMGIDLETFDPAYEVIDSRKKAVAELRKLAKASGGMVYLATDLDREGEAIAWHLKEALGLSDSRTCRVIFNAITRDEIKKAFSAPTQIDMHRVNAQEARRILDRVVGYEVSPILWRKVARGLSAGRVQSVAVKLIVDREREIEAFVPEEYWSVEAVFTAARVDLVPALRLAWGEFLKGDAEPPSGIEQRKWLEERKCFRSELVEWNGAKYQPKSINDVRGVVEALGLKVTNIVEEPAPATKTSVKGKPKLTVQGTLSGGADCTVLSLDTKRTQTRPPAPFITSTIQQAAASRLSLASSHTMRLAQQLYENGFITYMRTDSTHLSNESVAAARQFIGQSFGPGYLPPKPNFFASSNKSAQEAHEAIRPTEASLTPEIARTKMPADQWRLYNLIWSRFVACQMSPAQWDQTQVVIEARATGGTAKFRSTGRKLVFDGFMRVTGIYSEDAILPELAVKQKVSPMDLTPLQHFTQPPARFTEASLVGELEKLGIGRPSTYASTIETIQKKYVLQIEKRFHPTLLGRIVTDKLVEAFPEILDVQFTKKMESQLDGIEDQGINWKGWLRSFYVPFHETVKAALRNMTYADGYPSKHVCEKCGKPMNYHRSKFGFFLGCTGRPDCDVTKGVDLLGNPKERKVSEYLCPNCGKAMIEQGGRFGTFLGCSGYPECSATIPIGKDGKPLPPKAPPVDTPLACPKCSGMLLLRSGKRGPWLSCSKFPKCRGLITLKSLPEDQRKVVDELIPKLQAPGGAAPAPGAQGTAPAPAAASKAVLTDVDCPECGAPMAVRQSRRGAFLGCSKFPKCKGTREMPAARGQTDEAQLPPSAESEGDSFTQDSPG